MLQDFSADFTLKESTLINLNNGTLGLCPDSVIDFQCSEIRKFESNTSEGLGNAWGRLWEVQKDLAEFLSASPYDLFLRPNVTVALNDVIMGLFLPVKSEILTCQFEYGAIVNILKLKAQKENLQLRFMNVDFMFEPNLTTERVVDAIVSQISTSTSVIMLSHIFTGTGFLLPLNELGKKLREKGVFLIVDGAHGPGLLPLNFKDDLKHVDFYAGNLHKWVLGPKGTAFAWVHPEKQKDLQNVYASWTVFECPEHFKPFGGSESFATRMLWSHSQSFASFYGIQKTLQFWRNHGISKIQNELMKRKDLLKSELSKAGLNPVVKTESFQSGLLCYDFASFSEENFVNPMVIHIKGNTPVMVGHPKVPGRKVLRLSAHIHNSPAEINSALSSLVASLR